MLMDLNVTYKQIDKAIKTDSLLDDKFIIEVIK